MSVVRSNHKIKMIVDALSMNQSLFNDSSLGEVTNSDTSDNSTVTYSTPSLFCGAIMITVASIGVLGNVMTTIVFGFPKLATTPVALTTTTSASNNNVVLSKRASTAVITSQGSSFSVGGGSAPKLSSISILVTGLASADAFLLSVSCPLFAASAFMTYSPTLSMMNAVSYMTVYVYPLASMFQTISVWTLSVITIERYIAVVHPFLARIICTPSRAVFALAAIFSISAVYNAPRFWEYAVYKLEAADDPSVVLVIAVPTLRVDENYMRIYGHWMYFVFMFALPFTILVVFNGSVVRSVRTARRRRQTLSRQQTKEQGTAVMMVLVALVFLACNLLAFLLNALEVFGVSGAHRLQLPGGGDSTSETVRHSSTFYLLVDFNNLLVMTHCSLNFFIYYNFSQRFRLGCFRVWSRCACFRAVCNKKLRQLALASAAAVAADAISDNADGGHAAVTNDRRRSAIMRRKSSAMTGNGVAEPKRAPVPACRVHIKNGKATRSSVV